MYAQQPFVFKIRYATSVTTLSVSSPSPAVISP